MRDKLTILAIDDDSILLKSLARILKLEPIRLLTTTDPYQAVPLIQNNQVDLVLLDLQMPGLDGISVLEKIKQQRPDLPVLMLTGQGSIQTAVKAVKLGADDFLEKPCPPATLVQRIREFYPQQSHNNTTGDKTTEFNFPQLIGDSVAMQQLKRLLIRVAKTDAAILLHGETGVGKELVARAIHQHSPRNKEIFVPVDCATISEKILESELFGHRKGSFTGAEADKEGLFLAADQGSLFLDEIGEFQLELQAKLLRVLQERQVRPVGSNKASAINIRLIAATNKNLLQEVEQGHFRSDLYYRLAAIEIEVPPLRERCDDIPLLVAPLLQRQTLDPDCSFSPQAMEQLKRYNWPGNIRELENVITRAVTLCEGQSITLADLPAKIRQNQPTTATACLDSFEKTALESALDQARGNRRQAAEQLGISEATLYRKLKKAGLSKARD